MAFAEEEEAGITGCLEARARVVVERRVLYPQGSGAVIAHEEDRAAALAGVVELDNGAGYPQVVRVPVVVDGAAAAAVEMLAGRVAVRERDVLRGELGIRLVLGSAMWSTPAACRTCPCRGSGGCQPH